MRIVDVMQGSPEWFAARAGKPTASRFKEILTPAQLKLSKSSEDYAIELAIELKGIKDESLFSGNRATERGNEFEPIAANRYEELTELVTMPVGFVLPKHSDDYGCSPDRLVLNPVGDAEGLLEIKTRYPKRMMKCLLDPDSEVKEYMLQVQAQLWITGFEWCDLFIWSPEIEHVVCRRIEPDEKHFNAFEKAIPAFVERVHELAEKVEPAKTKEVCER